MPPAERKMRCQTLKLPVTTLSSHSLENAAPRIPISSGEDVDVSSRQPPCGMDGVAILEEFAWGN